LSELDALVRDLNDPQREAVEHGDGPLLIVAGAGSGKTRVITRRIAHLIARGVSPYEILAITFTNKAAGEMRERVAGLVGEGRVTVGTFHGFCARVLRIDGEVVGLPRDFTIYATDDQLALVRDILKELAYDPQTFRPRGILSAISRRKNDGLDPEDVLLDAASPYEKVVGRVYERYARSLREAHAVDFDDLLLKAVALMSEHPEVRARYQQRYRHVLVDEYQDTNHIQYVIARDIAAGSGNLCATGDPDQSIYRWRGARIRNILDFETDFPGARIVRLEQNYRSTGHILDAASSVIAHNPGRLMGPLWSELGEGEPVTVLAADDEESEADAIVDVVEAQRAGGASLADVAVFYRTNAMSRALERALGLRNVPYEIVGAVEFYQRREIKDLLAYLRVLVNPNDALAFLRIVNVPARGIGKTTLAHLRSWAVPQGLTPRDAARRAGECPNLTARARKALAAFTLQLDGLEPLASGPPEEALEAVVDRTGYADVLRDYGGQEALDRLENVAELQAAAADYSRAADAPSVAGFLEETALVSDVDAHDEQAERLTLMTLHSAKGLEFGTVVVAGMEEGLLPHQRALDGDAEDVHEERRLCYVGMTRARRRLVLSYAGRRAIRGQWAPTVPSRFLAELPREALVHDDRRRARPWMDDRPRYEDFVADVPFEPDLDADVAEGGLPAAGQRVRHAHFGSGIVTDVIGSGGKARIHVRFDRFGHKQLMAEYARLMPDG